MGTLHEDVCTFMISRSILPKMRNVSEQSCLEETKAHMLCSIIVFENCAVYEIMWGKYGTAGQATDDNIVRCIKDLICLSDN
jgi:hypothetical protein